MMNKEVQALLSANSLNLDEAATALNALTHAERVAVIRSLGGKDQAAAFEAAKGQTITETKKLEVKRRDLFTACGRLIEVRSLGF